MKLPQMTATHTLCFSAEAFYAQKPGIRFFRQIELQTHEGDLQLKYYPKEADKAKLTLYGCIRPIGGMLDNKIENHCFFKVMDKQGTVVDSLAFSTKDTLLPGFTESKPNAQNATCKLVGEITQNELSLMKGNFEKCDRKGFSFTRNNCCTCANEALKQIGYDSVQYRNFLDAYKSV